MFAAPDLRRSGVRAPHVRVPSGKRACGMPALRAAWREHVLKRICKRRYRDCDLSQLQRAVRKMRAQHPLRRAPRPDDRREQRLHLAHDAAGAGGLAQALQFSSAPVPRRDLGVPLCEGPEQARSEP